VARLVAKSPCEGLLPLSAGGVTLTEVRPEAITSVAPLAGQGATVSRALEKAARAAFPAPGRWTGGDIRIVWTGPDQAMVLGPRVAPEGAAVTDQSDAWAVMRLEGEGAEAVLARLVPVDVRIGPFPPGHAARTMLHHMTCTLMRVGDRAFEIMVFRSMAATAVHDLATAMRSVAALEG
jgi:heterotetrameric sarcosine oxidase gamma subunit